MNQRVLITGGAGFTGSALGLGLAQRYPDWQITALDNLKRRGSELNLPRLQQAGIRFIHGDVRNTEDLEPIALKPDLILECSAEPSVMAGYTSPGYAANESGRNSQLSRISSADSGRFYFSVFITDSRKVMSATSWRPQKDAKTTLTEIYEWIHQFKQQVSDIFIPGLVALTASGQGVVQKN